MPGSVEALPNPDAVNNVGTKNADSNIRADMAHSVRAIVPPSGVSVNWSMW